MSHNARLLPLLAASARLAMAKASACIKIMA
jgi:hypothetical protein